MKKKNPKPIIGHQIQRQQQRHWSSLRRSALFCPFSGTWLSSFPFQACGLLDGTVHPSLPALYRLPFCFLLCSLSTPVRLTLGQEAEGVYFHRKFIVCFSLLPFFPPEEEEQHTLFLRVFLPMELPCYPPLPVPSYVVWLPV